MDNYQVAINGTGIAARFLGIKTPDVQFFYNHDLSDRGINSIFLKEEYIIAYNEEWIVQADPLEVQITCFHESRHAYQWKCITGDYSGKHNTDPKTIHIWKTEMTNYSQPTSKEIPEEAYLCQEIEVDAIAFAHYLMSKLYGATTVIPDLIKQKVIRRKIDLMEEFR